MKKIQFQSRSVSLSIRSVQAYHNNKNH